MKIFKQAFLFFIFSLFLNSSIFAQGHPGGPGGCWPPPCLDCSEGDGLKLILLGEIDNVSDCGLDGYSNFSFLSTELIAGYNYELTISTGYGNQFISIWIDFNDNNEFETDELIMESIVIAGDQEGPGEYTETLNLIIPLDAMYGEHLIRIKTNRNNPVPNDETIPVIGEVEIYTTVILSSTVGIKEHMKTELNFSVAYLPDNRYEISLFSEIENEIIVNIMDITGRTLVIGNIANIGDKYEFDMSFAPAGVYLVRLYNENIGKVKKIVVK